MGWLRRFLHGRRKLLETNEPERAFAPDPGADTFPLAAGKNNDEAFAFIRRQGLSLLGVASGEVRSLRHFAGGMLLFATQWEPYSAKTIGSLRSSVEAGQIAPLGIVLFEDSREDVASRKSESWYFSQTYVLAPQSAPLRPLVGRVPFRVFVGNAGVVERIVEGKM